MIAQKQILDQNKSITSAYQKYYITKSSAKEVAPWKEPNRRFDILTSFRILATNNFFMCLTLIGSVGVGNLGVFNQGQFSIFFYLVFQGFQQNLTVQLLSWNLTTISLKPIPIFFIKRTKPEHIKYGMKFSFYLFTALRVSKFPILRHFFEVSF